MESKQNERKVGPNVDKDTRKIKSFKRRIPISLEMIALYLNPIIYILFSFSYFMHYFS